MNAYLFMRFFIYGFIMFGCFDYFLDFKVFSIKLGLLGGTLFVVSLIAGLIIKQIYNELVVK